MYPHALEHQGLWYRTPEALFQVLRFEDAGVRSATRDARSPMTAKMIAKANADKMVVVPRSVADLANMRSVLALKLAQHAEVEALLRGTGDALLIEDCTARQSESGLFWGMARIWNKGLPPEGWKGENWLGKLWMEHRAALQKG